MRVRLNQAGETIVEVMMSIAMLSIAIVGSIVVARQSLLIGQAANERTQAVKIAETQVERLKAASLSSTVGTGVFGFTGSFCIREDLTLVTAPTSNQADCSNTYFPSSSLSVTIDYDATGPTGSPFDDDLFVISVSWDNVRGEGRDSIVIDYRLHPV